jgi:two-component system response regulator DevR
VVDQRGTTPSHAQRAPYASTRVVVADRSVISRIGVRAILERHPDTAVVAEASNYNSVKDAVDEHNPDVLLFDLDLGDDTNKALTICADITETHPETRIIVLASSVNELVLVEAIRNGAVGYLIKDSLSAEELSRSVRRVKDGEQAFGKDITALLARAVGQKQPPRPSLSKREVEVIRLIAEGNSNKAIASKLYISEGTVKFHVKNSFEKLGVHTRAELVRQASAKKLI